MIRVQVWAKSRITRAGLEAVVAADGRFEIAAADERNSSLLSLSACPPDVLLVDPGDEPIARVLRLAEMDPPEAAVVALIDGTKRTEILRTLQSGVRCLLLRDSHPQEIAAALQATHDGLAVISPEILDVLVPPSDAGAAESTLDEPLTARETEVLAMLAEGAGNKEIAARLNVSEHTVKFHVSSILGKLGAVSRTEAVARGFKEGLILI